VQLVAHGLNQNFFTSIAGTEITMALVLISFITFLIAGLVQILNRRQSLFFKDCDERIEVKKLELKEKLKNFGDENFLTKMD